MSGFVVREQARPSLTLKQPARMATCSTLNWAIAMTCCRGSMKGVAALRGLFSQKLAVCLCLLPAAARRASCSGRILIFAGRWTVAWSLTIAMPTPGFVTRIAGAAQFTTRMKIAARSRCQSYSARSVTYGATAPIPVCCMSTCPTCATPVRCTYRFVQPRPLTSRRPRLVTAASSPPSGTAWRNRILAAPGFPPRSARLADIVLDRKRSGCHG